MIEVKHLKTSSVANMQSYRTNCDSAHTGYRYNLSYHGNYVIDEMTADDVREVIACLQYALELNGEKEGGEQ